MKPAPSPAKPTGASGANTKTGPFLSIPAAIPVAVVAVASFHAAYEFQGWNLLIAVFVFCLYRLTHLETTRQAFYFGLFIGLAIYGPQLAFFWGLFGAGAIALWLVLAFWLGLFLGVGHASLVRFGPLIFAFLAPFLWTGLEYFRSELYFLRFSWLNIGYAFSTGKELLYLSTFGVYGIGFLLFAAASVFYILPVMKKRSRILTLIILGGTCLYPMLRKQEPPSSGRSVRLAGVQTENMTDTQVKGALDKLIKQHPDTDLVVLSEYAFFGPIPDLIKKWCQEHGKYLIAGGKEPISEKQFYNTAFVIDPKGEVAFRQVKSVPIQFFNDGLPAPEQKLWDSPWGKLGIAICYDGCYTRVIDRLVRQGAQGLILPTMDMVEWGEKQHQLHARVIPMRAAEHRVPVFRLCSSGISLFSSPTGVIKASAPFPGEEAMIAATMELPQGGRIPPDRILALVSVVLTIATMSWLGTHAYARWRVTRTLSKSRK